MGVEQSETPTNGHGPARILQWRPRESRPAGERRSEYVLWSMGKNRSRIDCTVEDLGPNGWRAVFRFNGDWLFGCRFESWEEAIVAADAKHADLETSGWIPNPLVRAVR